MKKIISVIAIILTISNFVQAQQQSKIDSLRQVIKAYSKNDTIKVQYLFELGKEYEKNSLDSTEFIYEKALKVSKTINSKIFEAESYNRLGNFYYYRSNFKKTLQYWGKELKIYTEIENLPGIGQTLANIGAVYFGLADYPNALKYWQKAIIVEELNGNVKAMAIVYGNIGLIYASQENYIKALSYFEKALEANKSLGNKNGVATNYNNISGVYIEQKKYNKAMKYAKIAKKINEEIKNLYGVAINLGMIADLYLKKNEIDKSLTYYNQALEINKKIGDKYYTALYLSHVASIYIQKKEYKTAIKYAEKSLKLASETGALINKKDSYYYLAKAYAETGNFKKAYYYKNLYIDVKDSIYNDEKSKAIAEMQVKYESEKKEKQILQHQSELKASKIETQKQRYQRNMFVIAFGIAIILIIIGLIFYKQKNMLNKLLRKYQNETIQKNKDLVEAIKTNNKFFNILAHDLRNPINAITALSQIFIDSHLKSSEKEREEMIQAIFKSSSNTNVLLEELLEWATAKTGRVNYEPKQLSLEEIFKNTLASVWNNAVQKNINLEHSFLGAGTVFADENMLNTVLRNLTSNAIKFTNRNGKVQLLAIEDDENTIIKVIDNGIGISEKKQVKLFDISKKITTLGTENEKGTGLGLALCKEFVEKHNGIIEVESKLGKGTTFTLIFPKN